MAGSCGDEGGHEKGRHRTANPVRRKVICVKKKKNSCRRRLTFRSSICSWSGQFHSKLQRSARYQVRTSCLKEAMLASAVHDVSMILVTCSPNIPLAAPQAL